MDGETSRSGQKELQRDRRTSLEVKVCFYFTVVMVPPGHAYVKFYKIEHCKCTIGPCQTSRQSYLKYSYWWLCLVYVCMHLCKYVCMYICIFICFHKRNTIFVCVWGSETYIHVHIFSKIGSISYGVQHTVRIQ